MDKRLLVTILFGLYISAIDASPRSPTPGDSATIDQIKRVGEIRVAVLPEYPYLLESLTGSGDKYYGPAWTIAKEFASRLQVSLKAVPVSHETKVPSLELGKVDVIIAPMWVTPKRQEVVDFVIYSQSGLCFFGLKSNKALQNITTLEALNDPTIRLVYFVGGPSEKVIKPVLPDVTYRAVPGSGSNAPIEEIMARRADIAPIVSSVWPKLKRTLPTLRALPNEKACASNSLLPHAVGMAVRKDDEVFKAWLQEIVNARKDDIEAEMARLVSF